VDAPLVVGFSWHGTLVDDREGLVLALESRGITREAARRVAGAIRPALAAILEGESDHRPFHEQFARAVGEAAASCDVPLPAGVAEAAAATLPDWPWFPEVPDALTRLAGRYRLAVVANGDREDLESALASLPGGAGGIHLVASSDLEAYKPDPDLFLAVLHEMEIDEEDYIHLSDDPRRDLVTLHDLGVPSGWIRRRTDPLPEEVAVQLEAPDLRAAADRLLGGG
jgi:FMN phosphatase YigB (HAD superfamily)